jgi:urocanate hydratase
MGVIRHVDSGYDEAKQCAETKGENPTAELTTKIAH